MTQWESFCARPAEGTVTGGGGRGGAGGGAAGELAATGGGRGAAEPSPENIAKVFQIIGLNVPSGGGRGGRGGGAGGFPGAGRGGAAGGVPFIAVTGDYSVVLRIGTTVQKQRLRLENVGAGGSGSPFGPASGDEGDVGRAKAKARAKSAR